MNDFGSTKKDPTRRTEPRVKKSLTTTSNTQHLVMSSWLWFEKSVDSLTSTWRSLCWSQVTSFILQIVDSIRHRSVCLVNNSSQSGCSISPSLGNHSSWRHISTLGKHFQFVVFHDFCGYLSFSFIPRTCFMAVGVTVWSFCDYFFWCWRNCSPGTR